MLARGDFMKIEKLSKDNIEEFIRDMKISDNNLELDIAKKELYGVLVDDTFCLGFNSLAQMDTIAILYYGYKLTDKLFFECIDFLDRSLVVENHLIIEVYDEKHMKLLEDRYKCREVCTSLALDGSVVKRKDIWESNTLVKEKFVDIEMKSIKYYVSKDMVICSLVKQNIQDEKIILLLHNEFVNKGAHYISFSVFPDSLEYLKKMGYTCMSKSFVIKND